jgi:hypothetical protein
MGRSAVFHPYDIFYFVLVEGGRGTLEAVVQWSLQTPEDSWFESVSRNRSVYVSSRAVEIITLKISEK